ncbi:hypothetical protein FHX15_002434 [Rhizobium sp. BK650]|uniref:hypothetical protein n=1 Tax=Rhizobium sp. BK650 TaxID=2586990 RepID=UPI001607E79F|nr:hypothetical protein [Rhizobium sp. BK650]MBB3657202.1 hypothetical protein [Rhizobium sp. BK650]
MFHSLILVLYGAIAGIALAVTLLEGWVNHDRWTIHRIAGMIACLFWPLPLAFFILHGSFSRLVTRFS